VRRRDLLAAGTGLAVVSACGHAAAPPASTGASGRASSAAGVDEIAGWSPPPIPLAELKRLYEYDQTAALGATLNDRVDEAGIRFEDLNYANGRGGQTTASVVSPLPVSTRRLPGVVFAHGGGSGIGRTTWLAEAKALVGRGMVAALPEVPFQVNGDPAHDSELIVHAVVAQRRALDLLARRSDVDPGRLGFVGHSWGATQAQILAGIDARLAAVIVVSGGEGFSRFLYRYLHPAAGRGYLDALSRFDGGRYTALPGKRAVLLQFGRHDENTPVADQDALADRTAGNHQRKDYDAGHDLVGLPAAVADRQAFLRSVLHLR
jgi:dienelactone hydrolase